MSGSGAAPDICCDARGGQSAGPRRIPFLKIVSEKRLATK
jgi:hypothetical protein